MRDRGREEGGKQKGKDGRRMEEGGREREGWMEGGRTNGEAHALRAAQDADSIRHLSDDDSHDSSSGRLPPVGARGTRGRGEGGGEADIPRSCCMGHDPLTPACRISIASQGARRCTRFSMWALTALVSPGDATRRVLTPLVSSRGGAHVGGGPLHEGY